MTSLLKSVNKCDLLFQGFLRIPKALPPIAIDESRLFSLPKKSNIYKQNADDDYEPSLSHSFLIR